MTSLAFQDVQHAIIALMPDLRRFARSLTQSADAADDLVQTAYEGSSTFPMQTDDGRKLDDHIQVTPPSVT